MKNIANCNFSKKGTILQICKIWNFPNMDISQNIHYFEIFENRDLSFSFIVLTSFLNFEKFKKWHVVWLTIFEQFQILDILNSNFEIFWNFEIFENVTLGKFSNNLKLKNRKFENYANNVFEFVPQNKHHFKKSLNLEHLSKYKCFLNLNFVKFQSFQNFWKCGYFS